MSHARVSLSLFLAKKKKKVKKKLSYREGALPSLPPPARALATSLWSAGLGVIASGGGGSAPHLTPGSSVNARVSPSATSSPGRPRELSAKRAVGAHRNGPHRCWSGREACSFSGLKDGGPEPRPVVLASAALPPAVSRACGVRPGPLQPRHLAGSLPRALPGDRAAGRGLALRKDVWGPVSLVGQPCRAHVALRPGPQQEFETPF